jgi:hypothetical protein
VFSRTDQAVKDHKITAAMGDREHEVRLGQNRDRLTTRALVWSAVEAKQSAEFADALGYFLFVLTNPKAALEPSVTVEWIIVQGRQSGIAKNRTVPQPEGCNSAVFPDQDF